MKQIIYFTILILLFSCDDIIEEDIQHKNVVILSPPDGFRSSEENITFWWESLDGASDYSLQIVQPSFENVERLVKDTVITNNQLSIHFTPGDYEWRIKAKNNGFETSFFKRSFTIE